jgi:hypothetical protein
VGQQFDSEGGDARGLDGAAQHQRADQRSAPGTPGRDGESCDDVRVHARPYDVHPGDHD